MIAINVAEAAGLGDTGITSEPLLFILAILVVVFTSQSLWGTIQKYIEKRKSKSEGDLDGRKLDFEIDKFSIETVQQAVLSNNKEIERVREDNNKLRAEFSALGAQFAGVAEKNAAMFRYIAKTIAKGRYDGTGIIPVDEADHLIIPEIVNLTR